MTYQEIVSRVSKELNLPEDLIIKTYKAYWLFIKDTIEALPLKENISDEEFSELRTCINVPSLGKFHCTRDRYEGIKKRFEYIKNLKENHAEY